MGLFICTPVVWGQLDSRGSTWIQQHAQQGAAIGYFVSSFPSGYNSPDDVYGISATESAYSLIKPRSAKMNTKSGYSGSGGGGKDGTTTAESTATPTTAAVKDYHLYIWQRRRWGRSSIGARGGLGGHEVQLA